MSSVEIAGIEAVGLDPARVEALRVRARREVEEGLLPAVQIAVARNGRLAMFESFGTADSTSLFCLFSATKAITSAAIWLLMQDGRLSVDEKVADVIPAFGSNGKESITVEQLLLHTAGFPAAPFKSLDWINPTRRWERFSQWRLSWPPGSRFEYHPTSTMWALAEIIEQRSGIAFQQFIRERICQPLDLLDLFVGLPERENHRVVPCAMVGEPLTPADYQRLGVPAPPVTEVTEDAILSFNDPAIRAVGVPGGGGITSAAQLALFYQALLHGGLDDSAAVWSRETLTSARRVRTGELRDPLFHKLVNRGLGIVIAGDESRSYRGFGKTNSPEAFGHNGAGGQLAWVDPASGISLAYLTSGHDRNEIRQARRGVAISSLAAVCAGEQV
ncbi:MAG: serine hydrolase domain-containing protein [Pseudomonadales bacterium]